MNAWDLFWRFALASLLAFGGGAGIPLIERIAVREAGWIGEREFASAVGFGQVVPGPVMVVATFIGYRVAGVAGAVAATIGVFLIPSVLAASAARQIGRSPQRRWLRGFRRGAAASAVGLFGVTARQSRATGTQRMAVLGNGRRGLRHRYGDQGPPRLDPRGRRPAGNHHRNTIAVAARGLNAANPSSAESKSMQESDFDAVAGDFDRFRALPAGVPEAIRRAIGDALGIATMGRVLDLGAGTGRIGEAFVAAGDSYIGVDASARMLARFAEKLSGLVATAPALAQADGLALPFPAASFDAVLMVQVIGGSTGWRGILSEARRVLRPGGSIVLGKAVGPPLGLDGRMRERLSLILADAGVEMHRRGVRREDALAWLAPAARRLSTVVAARWETTRSPRDFLARHATGARFAALAQPVKDEALRRLAEWAIATFGTLDAPLVEQHAFLLDLLLF